MIQSKLSRWWLVPVAIMLFSGVSAAAPWGGGAKGCGFHDFQKCRQVADGGSAAVYLLGVGVTCLGAIFVGSRFAKRRAS